MIKTFKTIALVGVVLGCIGLASHSIMASDRAENIALNDYKAGQSQKNIMKNISPQENEDGIKLSDFSIPIYNTIQGKEILSTDAKNISKILKSTDEKLWFMMNQNEPEGIVVANNVNPIKMGGKNRSKDLMKIYKDVKSNMTSKQEIKYFEFEGQGVFFVSGDNGDDVYLSIGASKILNMDAGKKLSSVDVISQMKKHISSLQKNN